MLISSETLVYSVDKFYLQVCLFYWTVSSVEAETILLTIVIRLKVMLVVQNPPANAGDDVRDTDLILGFGKIPWRRK